MIAPLFLTLFRRYDSNDISMFVEINNCKLDFILFNGYRFFIYESIQFFSYVQYIKRIKLYDISTKIENSIHSSSDLKGLHIITKINNRIANSFNDNEQKHLFYPVTLHSKL